MDDTAELAYILQELLLRLNITYTLCYGSLWGALRINKQLPWDADLDLCIMKEDLMRFEEATLHRMFRAENLGIEYDNRQVCIWGDILLLYMVGVL